MGSPIIFNGNYAKILKGDLKLADNAYLVTDQTADPTSTAYDAPQGSLYFRNGTNQIYRKTDNGSTTNWVLISDHGGMGGLADNDHPQYVNHPYEINNLRVDCSVSSNALTLTLNGQNGSSLSSSNYGIVSFPNVSTNSGYNTVTMTSSVTLTIPSGATMGHNDAKACPLYVYLQYNSGSPELVASSSLLDEGTLQTSTTISTSADDGGIYATTGRSSQSIRLIAVATSTQTTAGTWAANVTKIVPASFNEYALGTQYTQSSTTSASVTSPTKGTWYQTHSSVNVTLPAGVYDFYVEGVSNLYTTAASTYVTHIIQLGQSNTPGTNMFGDLKCIQMAMRTAAGDNVPVAAPFSVSMKNQTLSNPTTVYVNSKCEDFSGTSTPTSLGFTAVATGVIALRLVAVRVA